MFDDQSESSAPADAQWTDLTGELLRSPERDTWEGLVDGFEPYPLEPSHEMTNNLREGVCRGALEMKTRAIHHNGRLLGFYSVSKEMARISDRSSALASVAEALGLRSSKPGLLLSSIVRSRHTPPGFGGVLLEDAVGVALTDKELKALFVEPANERVAAMWQENYHFKLAVSSEVPGLLYLPLP
jgi:hypothetical protein